MNNNISENIISFKRLSSKLCSAYRIYVKEYIESDIKEYILDEIINPNISLDIEERKVVKYNEKQKWQLKDEVTNVSSSSIDVFVNHNKLELKLYTFNIKNKVLTIHLDLNKTDIIEIGYRIDSIYYSHRTQNMCEYTVVPIFKRSNLIGNHTLL